MTLLANIFSFSTIFSRMFSRTHKFRYLRAISKKEKTSKPLRFQGFLWSCWADSNCRPHPYQLPWSLPAPAVQGFSAVFCPKRMRSQPVCSIVSIRAFPRVGHGVGQADTSASKKPRMGCAVTFRFAASRS